MLCFWSLGVGSSSSRQPKTQHHHLRHITIIITASTTVTASLSLSHLQQLGAHQQRAAQADLARRLEADDDDLGARAVSWVVVGDID